MFDQFAKMFRRSGLDDIAGLYDQQEQPEQDFSYKRGPAAQSYMDYIGQEPDLQGPSTWQRIAAAMAGIGAKDARVTQQMIREPYERSRRDYMEKGNRLKSAADFEEKESDNQRQSANYASLENRRRDRSKNELREGIRRSNVATAQGARADNTFNWRVAEKDQDQAAAAQRSKDSQAGAESRFQRGQAAIESRFKRSQDRMNDPSMSPEQQKQLDELASKAIAAEFADKFNVVVDKRTGKTSRTLKPDIDDATASVIEKRHLQLKNEIATRRRSSYNVPEIEGPDEDDMAGEDPEEEEIEGVDFDDDEVNKKLDWLNFMMSLRNKF